VTHRAILGPAGSGKTTLVRKDYADDGTIFTSTTGCSAVNLADGATTIHSLLHFHNPETFAYQVKSEGLQHSLVEARCHRLIIDEVSMMQADMLDAILKAADDVGVDVILTGDFCQLPPVPECNPCDPRRKLPFTFAFEGHAWSSLDLTSLSGSYRHADPQLRDALHSIRRATDVDVECFRPCFDSEMDMAFAGTTLFGRNAEVDRFNGLRLRRLTTEEHTYTPIREGQQHPDWRDICPVTVKSGARVMITRNLRRMADGFARVLYATNGDTGIITSCDEGSVAVHLDRTNDIVPVVFFRQCWYKPGTEAQARAVFDGQLVGTNRTPEDVAMALQAMQPILDAGTLGSIQFLSLRIAYALTVHKAQGLTLDAAQISLHNNFMGHPAMTYVALSRVRALSGLRLIGSPTLLRMRCQTHPKVQPYV
jgi:ATP-dependent DNA helicase PIF1